MSQSNLSEQIAQLQQRHAAMVQQTQAELARLQQEMLIGGQTHQLQQQLAQAEQEKQMLQQQLVATHQQYQEQYQQLLSSFSSLKQVQSPLQPLQSLTTATPPLFQVPTQPIAPSSAPIHPAPSMPVTSVSDATAPLFTPVDFNATSFWQNQVDIESTPVATTAPSINSFPEKEDVPTKSRRLLFVFRRRTKKQKAMDISAPTMSPEVIAAQAISPAVDGIRKKKHKGGFRRVAVRFAVFALLATGGYLGWNKYLAPSSEAGSVAGIQTGSEQPGGAEQERYREAYADVPFEQTQWETLNDPDLGISIDWPKNTTNMSRVVGGTNLWFLRKNGYLFRFSIPDSVVLPLDQWWDQNKATYLNNATETRVTFKGKPAVRVTQREVSATSGTSYYFSTKLGITQVWVKDEPPTTDDGQRLKRMVDSLTFK